MRVRLQRYEQVDGDQEGIKQTPGAGNSGEPLSPPGLEGPGEGVVTRTTGEGYLTALWLSEGCSQPVTVREEPRGLYPDLAPASLPLVSDQFLPWTHPN